MLFLHAGAQRSMVGSGQQLAAHPMNQVMPFGQSLHAALPQQLQLSSYLICIVKTLFSLCPQGLLGLGSIVQNTTSW